MGAGGGGGCIPCGGTGEPRTGRTGIIYAYTYIHIVCGRIAIDCDW